MESLVESVPNFSEGASQGTIDGIARVVRSHAGAWLLDVSADADHQRSVFTIAGFPGRVMTAMEAAVEAAIEGIDMRVQHGEHPCIGAVDVIPFVPLGDTTMEQCAEGARRFAELVAERFALPVYLYAEAAIRPERRGLAAIRRPGFAGLAGVMREPGHEPDFGPLQPHPTAGATAIGARPFLIAYNIQLSTTDVAVAKRLATRVRERDGGLPAVQALGLYLASQGCAQLSMNILDHTRTPLWRLWEAVAQLAQLEHVSVLDSELVGLAPAAALTEVADHIGVATGRPIADRITEAARWLRIRRFDPSAALELRLAAMRAAH
jgi:glutamate formiminotransferase / 5-formyltetrahydrofolate cyclo-ligase